jgi:hypothetical protein
MAPSGISALGLNFAWYGLVPGPSELEQGDLLFDFPVAEPPIMFPTMMGKLSEGESLEAETTVKTYNLILMSQSCDLPKLLPNNYLIMCPVYDFKSSRLPDGRSLASPDYWAKLRKGAVVFAHLLNKCEIPEHEFDYLVVDLQRIVSVPFRIVNDQRVGQTSRVRLLPPYREHLAQAFARQFMRIGLPVDLPTEYPYQ